MAPIRHLWTSKHGGGGGGGRGGMNAINEEYLHGKCMCNERMIVLHIFHKYNCFPVIKVECKRGNN